MCEFCDTYFSAKKEARERKKKHGINTYFKVRLYEYSVKNRVCSGSLTYRGMKLVFCPTCGKRLNGGL